MLPGKFYFIESTRWCWELLQVSIWGFSFFAHYFTLYLIHWLYDSTCLNSSTSQQTQLRPPAFSSETLLTWRLLMKNCAPKCFPHPPKLWAHPQWPRALRAAMCKTSFRAPLTMFLLKPCCSLFTPIPLERGTHMAPVRWRNETIPFGIRKTGLEAISGDFEESEPLRSAMSTVNSCDALLFPVQLSWLQFPPIQEETSLTFYAINLHRGLKRSYLEEGWISG